RSALQLEGTVHEFFVDVNVDPASGRGKFRAVVRMDLAVFDTESQRQLWHEMYTGTASASAPSVIDSAYEKTLKVAFTNLLNQIRQDDNLLQLGQLYKPIAFTHPRPSPAPVPGPVQDQTPLRIMFLSPTMPAQAREMTTIAQVILVSGLILDTSETEKLRVEGATKVDKSPASAQILEAAGVKGPCIEFKVFVFLTPGVNRLEFQTVDRQGNPLRESFTIQRQVDTSPPKLALLEPRLTPAVVVRTNRARQL